MPFLEILKSIQDIRQTRSTEAKNNKIKALIESVANNQKLGDRGVNYLNQFLTAFGIHGDASNLSHATTSTSSPPTRPSPSTESQDDRLYHELLPLCQLAYLEEENGIPEDHARKLATIFKNKETAFSYLLHFERSNEYNEQFLLHDACLFELPTLSNLKQFLAWKEIANQGKDHALNMQNKRFRDLLPHAEVITKLMMAKPEQDKATTDQDKQKIDYKKIVEIQTKIIHTARQYKKVDERPITGMTDQQKEERKQARARLSVILLELNEALVTASRGVPLQNASLQTLQAFYQRYQNESNAAHRILVSSGISPANIALFNELERKNDDTLIPPIFIDGYEIGHPGCYLMKLDTMSDEGAAIAATLGITTNCCQYLGGAGSDCVKHGIESPNGGFYILFEGDPTQPRVQDPILAQAWVWRSDDGKLCLDSIESTIRTRHHLPIRELVIDMYRYLGMQLGAQFSVPQVNVGSYSGISGLVTSNSSMHEKLNPADYTGYSDASSQHLLAESDMPYLYYNEGRSDEFKKIVHEKTLAFIRDIFSHENPLDPPSAALNKLIAHLIYTRQTDQSSLYKLLFELAGPYSDKLNALFQLNYKYARLLSENLIDMDSLYQGANINLQGLRGKNALSIAVSKSKHDLVRQLIGCGADINSGGMETLLTLATQKNDESLVKLLIKYGANINSTNYKMESPLFIAAKNGNASLFHLLLNLNARVNVISRENRTNLLMAAAIGNNPEIINTLLLRSDIDRKYQDVTGKTFLHYCTVPMFIELCVAHPELKQMAVEIKDRNGASALQDAVTRFNIDFEPIFNTFSGDQKSSIILSPNIEGDTLLHLTDYPVTLQSLIQQLPVHAKPAAIKLKNKKGETPLHRYTHSSDIMHMMLNMLEPQDRLAAIQMKDNNGVSVIYAAARWPTVLRTILDSLPQADRSTAAQTSHPDGKIVFTNAHFDIEASHMILSLYPRNERLGCIQQACQQEANIDTTQFKPDLSPIIRDILHSLSGQALVSILFPEKINELSWINSFENCKDAFITNPKQIKNVLELLPKKHRHQALNVLLQDKDDLKVYFHHLLQDPVLLAKTMQVIPEDQRLAHVLRIIDDGKPLLHSVISNAEALTAIMNTLPSKDRLTAIQSLELKGITKGNNVLHSAISKNSAHYDFSGKQLRHNNPAPLKAILDAIPVEDRLPAVLAQKGDGHTILSMTLNQNPIFFKMILASLPEHERWHALKKPFQINIGKFKFDTSAYDMLENSPQNFRDIVNELIPEGLRHDSPALSAKYSTLFQSQPSSSSGASEPSVNMKLIPSHTKRDK